jgi:cyclopropane fatty-acyl-phospholipid synthase-like methyltransferase
LFRHISNSNIPFFLKGVRTYVQQKGLHTYMYVHQKGLHMYDSKDCVKNYIFKTIIHKELCITISTYYVQQ